MKRKLPGIDRRSRKNYKEPLKVIIITQEDPLYVIELFKIFFNEYPRDEIYLIGITIDGAFHESLPRTLRRLVGMYGWYDTLRLGARFLRKRIRGISISSLAARNGVKAMPTESVNDPDYIRRVREQAPDVILSSACPEIFSPALLAVPRLGCINIHSGRLPAYRGMMPTFWQMLRGEQTVTVTVHRMAERLDAGDILATREFPIEAADCLDRVILGTKREGARLLIRVLRDMRMGAERPVSVDMTGAGYFSFPRPENVREFRRRGHRLL